MLKMETKVPKSLALKLSALLFVNHALPVSYYRGFADFHQVRVKQSTSRTMISHTVTTILLPYRCEANCKPVNASDEVVLSVSGQKDSQATYYNWYLDNTFQTKVRASESSDVLHRQK